MLVKYSSAGAKRLRNPNYCAKLLNRIRALVERGLLV